MATDSTHLLPGNSSFETDTDMSASGSELGSVQLAAASPDAPISVNIPRGQQVVVIPVRPGQTIELPTDSPDGLLAKLGADGNLAIVVDGRTIILQGYAEANEQAPIKIVTNDGDVVDVADVIVATNPDVALDIQTAAGPAAAGAQGGTAGADAAGSGIFVPFAAGPLLGGIDAAGVLGATQLAYKTIDDDRILFTHDEKKAEDPDGDIDVEPETVVGEVSFAGGFEDWQPNQDTCEPPVAPMALNVTFTPADNEVLLTLKLSGFPQGSTLFIGDPTDGVVEPGEGSVPFINVDPASNFVVLTPEQIALGIFVLPPQDASGNIDLDFTATIQDPDGGLITDISGSKEIVIDAVAEDAEITWTIPIPNEAPEAPAGFPTDPDTTSAECEPVVVQVTVNEDNATNECEEDELQESRIELAVAPRECCPIDGEPVYPIGFTPRTRDDDGSEGITKIAIAFSENESDGGALNADADLVDVDLGDEANIILNGTTLSGAGTIVVNGIISQSDDGSFGPAEVTLAYVVTADGVVFTVQSATVGGNPVDPFAVQSLDLSDMQIELPQHDSDDFKLDVTVTTQELFIDSELVTGNNEATHTETLIYNIVPIADGGEIDGGEEGHPEEGCETQTFFEDDQPDPLQQGPNASETQLEVPLAFTASLTDADGSEGVTEIKIFLSAALGGLDHLAGLTFFDSDGELTGGNTTVTLNLSGGGTAEFTFTAVSNLSGWEITLTPVDPTAILGQNVSLNDLIIKTPIDDSTDIRADFYVATAEYENGQVVDESCEVGHDCVVYQIQGVVGPAITDFFGQKNFIEDGGKSTEECQDSQVGPLRIDLGSLHARTQDQDGSEGIMVIAMKPLPEGFSYVGAGGALPPFVNVQVFSLENGIEIVQATVVDGGGIPTIVLPPLVASGYDDVLLLPGQLFVQAPNDFSGDFQVTYDVVTQEFDDDHTGGGNLITPGSIPFHVDPAPDEPIVQLDGNKVEGEISFFYEDDKILPTDHGDDATESKLVVPIDFHADVTDPSEGLTKFTLFFDGAETGYVLQIDGVTIADGASGVPVEIDGHSGLASFSGDLLTVVFDPPVPDGAPALTVSGEITLLMPIDDSTDFTTYVEVWSSELDDKGGALDPEGHCTAEDFLPIIIQGVVGPALITGLTELKFKEDGGEVGEDGCQEPDAGPLVMPVSFKIAAQDNDGSESIITFAVDIQQDADDGDDAFVNALKLENGVGGALAVDDIVELNGWLEGEDPSVDPAHTVEAKITSIGVDGKITFEVLTSGDWQVLELEEGQIQIEAPHNGNGDFNLIVDATTEEHDDDIGLNDQFTTDVNTGSLVQHYIVDPVNDCPTIDFFPNDPRIKDGKAVVSDEGLANANKDSSPASDDTDSTVANGTFVVADPDGDALTVTIETTGLPALTFGGVPVAWSVSGDGHTLFGKTGGTDAIVVNISSVDGLNYNYTVTLLKPLDHPLTDDPSTVGTEISFEDETNFSVTLKVSDGNGGSDTAQLAIQIEDDSPYAIKDVDSVTEDSSVIATGNVITAADGGLGSDGNPTDGVADSVGADGFKSITWTDAVGGEIDTVYGKLFVDGSGNYRYELDNDNPLVQALTDGETKTETFTYTIEDNDGDKATTTLTITIVGSNDGPTIELDSKAVVSDEGLTDGNKDTSPSNDDTDSTVANGTFVVADPDGDALTVTIETTGLPALTFGGVPVAWSVSGDGHTLFGKTSGTDAIVVNISTVDGLNYNYTVTLLKPLDHPLTDDPSTVGTEISFEDETDFNVTLKVSDGTSSATTVLPVQIEDDSPINNAQAISKTVFEDGLTGLSTGIGGGTTTAVFTTADLAALVSSGADKPLTISLNAAIDGQSAGLSSKGDAITYDYVDATHINGVAGGRVVFTIVEAPAGTFTFTLLDQIDHTPLASGGGDSETTNLSLAGVFVATDYDHDAVVIDAGATVVINNDVPENNATTISKTVFEDGLTGLSTGIGGGVTTAVFTAAELAGLVSPGADEPVTIKLNAAIEGVDSGLDSKGFNIVYDYVDATHVNGVANGVTVFTIVESPAGTFTFTLLDQIDHTPLASGGGDSETISLSLAGVFTATDFDGDSVVIDAGATVVINNDVPENNATTISKTVFEDGLTGLSTGIGGGVTTVVFTAAELAGLVSPGADEPVTIKLNAAIEGVDSGLDSKGFNIVYDYVDATHVNGVANGVTVFTIVEAPAGTFTFTLLDQIDHTPLASGGGDSETISLSLAGVFTATDFDGDSVVIDAGATVVINNDVPENNATTISKTVFEDGLTGLSTGIGGGATTAVFTAAELAGLVSPGADEPVTIKLNAGVEGVDSGLDSKGFDIVYDYVDATHVNGVANGVTVFTIVESPAGTFTFTLLDQIDHTPLASGGGDSETISLSLAGVFTATDFDGDSVVIDAGATVVINNDVPENSTAAVTGKVDEDSLDNLSGIFGSKGNLDAVNDGTTATGSLASLVNAGADENVTFSLSNVTAGLTAQGLTSKGQALSYTVSGNTLTGFVNVGGGAGYDAGTDRAIFTLTLSGTNFATYAFVLLDQLDHLGANLSGSGDDQIKTIDFSSVVVATDFDGDGITVDNGFTIQVEDDLPIFTSADHGTVANVANISVIGDLITSVGADEPGTFGFGANDPAGLTSNGYNVFYQVAGNTLTAWADVDKSGGLTGADTQVFTLVLNGDSTYTFNLLQPLDAIETVTIGSSTAFGSGPTGFQLLSQGLGTTPLAILSGSKPGDPTAGVNGSTSGWGVNNNQFGDDERLRVDFFDQDGPVGPGSFSGPRVAAATVDLLDYSNGDTLEYTVQYMNPDGTPNGGPVTVPVTISGGGGNIDTTLTITAPAGLYIDYIDFHVLDANGEGGKFDLVNIQTFTNTGTLDLNFNVNLTDYDGDTVAGTIGVTVDGSTGTIAGTAANDAIAGDGTANTITGLAGHDDVYGGAGNDTISGGDGSDKIVGGLGNDNLTGGNDSDTFVYQTQSDGKDTITDFNIAAPASGGDKLDVSAVLDLGGNTWTDGGSVANAVAGGYLTFTNDGTGHVQVNVDIDGAGGAAATAVAVLSTVTFTTANQAATDLNDNIVVG